jgi:E3 ubiquitin-protein ligase AIP2
MATAQVAKPQAQNWDQIIPKFNKKSSYEEAARQCIDALTERPESVLSDAFRRAVRRALTVARSRFQDADVALWRQALSLVRGAGTAAPQCNVDPAFVQELQEYEVQCLAVLGDDGEVATTSTSSLSSRPSSWLFQGQLSDAPENPALPPTQDAMQQLAAALIGRETTAHDHVAPDTVASPVPDFSPEMTEALQRELDAIAVEIMEATAAEAPRAPPPASKSVVSKLPRIVITAEKLVELGGAEARCPVCFCLELGDEIMMLPCKHWAHPQCLDPWLAGTNTCPTCRHELLTEDDAYERRKEREKVREEERRGAENALSHKEFLYI